MKTQTQIKPLLIALTLFGLPAMGALAAPAASSAIVQKSFATPEETAQAFVDALRANDAKAIESVMGGAAHWLSSGDEFADQADRKKFVDAYQQKHALVKVAENKLQLTVGDADWPFAALLVKKPNGWVFDARTGREEMVNRRIGRNELDAIQTLLAIVDAQREFAADDPDGNGFNDYARTIRSSPGKHDGLYWPTSGTEPISPLGELVASAASEGYKRQAGDTGPLAYHGYRYRLLSAQGSHAKGGKYDYVVKGMMLGGFGIVAYPARYGVSGVMSFIVNHDGKVFEKNLGRSTEAIATQMKRFDPDSSWKASE